MNLIEYYSLGSPGGEQSLTIGKRSWDNLSPDILLLKILDGNLLEVQWEKYKFILHLDNRIGYWYDGFTGCEYDGFDKKRVDTNNQHMLECAYEVLEELELLIEKRGLYGNHREKK